ncbi:metallophosphoesterase [bacterium]|nr:metallophosphoesterase [bacterium]
MKVFVSSDIHFDHDPKNQELWALILEECKLDPPDIFIICGDLSESLESFHKALELFKDLDCHKFILPGNHDLWNRIDRNSNAWNKYDHELQEIAEANHWHYLPKRAFVCENWVFIGSPFWYDYSLMPDEHPFTVKDFQQKQYMGRVWQDRNYVNFPNFSDDFEICEYFYQRIKEDLIWAKKQKKRIFCCSHFPTHHEIFHFTGKNWAREYFGAFMGSNSYQKLLEEYQVSYLVSGHVHRQFDQEINGIRVILSPVGYVREWHFEDPAMQMIQSLKKLEI